MSVQQSTKRAQEVVLVQRSTIEAIGRLCWYSRVLKEHLGCCAGTEEYCTSTGETVLVQQSSKGALWRLCWYRRVL